jgi:hypothetical protein
MVEVSMHPAGNQPNSRSSLSSPSLPSRRRRHTLSHRLYHVLPETAKTEKVYSMS